MYKYLTLFLILCFYQIRSQTNSIPQNKELNIQTKFNQYGGLFETSSRNSPMIAQFNKGQKCVVKSYLGDNKFKIEYKRWVGYVTSDYLVINDELEAVINEPKEPQTIAIQKVDVDVAPKELGIVEADKKNEEGKVLEIEFKQGEIAERNLTEDKISEKGNSIGQTHSMPQNTELNIQTKFKQYGDLFETTNVNSPVKAQFNKGKKCIVKSYLGNGNFKIQYKKWVGYVTSDYLVINDELEAVIKKPIESQTLVIQKADGEVAPEELKIVQTEVKNKTVGPAQNEFILESNAEKTQTEDKINKQSTDIDRIELRFTCHYQMNEIDEFYNQRIVKTENYEVNDSLKIELYRIGNKKHVFMNFDGQLGCASYFSHNRSSAKIKLENNVIVTIYHSWNVDCGKFSLKGILTNSSISKLKESPIKSIKLQGTKGFIEIENIKYKEFFMDKLGCLD